jgi:serine/threonine-protein phosphatase PGAM5
VPTRNIYLIRHGEYDWDHDPSPQKGLTSRGVRQAELTAERLRWIDVGAIYSSDLRRAVETAEIIGRCHEGVPHHQRSNLRECLLPSLAFNQTPREHIQDGKAQAAEAFSEYLQAARDSEPNTVIVSHGNLIRYLAARVVRGSHDGWLRMRTFNCGITEITVESDGRLWLVTYNDVGHLPGELVTAGLAQRKGAPTDPEETRGWLH